MFDLFELLLNWNKPAEKSPEPEPTMKKRKIREMLSTILDKLSNLEAGDDVIELKHQLEAANERSTKLAADVRAQATKTRDAEDKLKPEQWARADAEKKLAAVERDRDGWKRECERYQATAPGAAGKEPELWRAVQLTAEELTLQSMLEWLTSWGDGTHWADATGATVPITKAVLRKLIVDAVRMRDALLVIRSRMLDQLTRSASQEHAQSAIICEEALEGVK